MLLYDAPNPTPNPRRVRIFLAEKGLTLPTKAMSVMAGDHKAPDFVAKYPPGQLPVLELDDGTMLGESIAICRYLDGLNPDPPLFGTTPREAAEIDMWTRRVEFTLGAALRQIWIHTHPLTARVVKQQFTEFGESNRPLAAAAMAMFDTALADRPFLAGNNYSIADIALLTTVDFGCFIGVAIPDDLSALAAWHVRVTARPSAAA
jgi:glutathione S-transferase